MVSQTIKSTRFFILGVILLGIITGCSGGGNPIIPPDQNDNIDLVNVSGSISLPEGSTIAMEQLKVMTVVGGEVPVTASGEFKIKANKNVPLSLLIVLDSTEKPILTALVGSDNTSNGIQIKVDARSTAREIAFLTPFVATTDSERIPIIFDYIESLPEFEDFLLIIEGALTNGENVFSSEAGGFASSFQQIYTKLLKFTSNRNPQRREQDYFAIIPPDSPHFNIWDRGESPEPLKGLFTMQNGRDRDVDAYIFPVNENGQVIDDGNDPPKVRLSSAVPGITISDIIAMGLDATGWFPSTGYSNTADFDMSFETYREFQVLVYGPGSDLLNYQGIDRARMEAAGIRSMITNIIDPLVSIIIGTRLIKLTCTGQILLLHGQFMWNALIATVDGGDVTKFIGKIPELVGDFLVEIAKQPCVPAAIVQMIGSKYADIAGVTIIYNFLVSSKDVLDGIYAIWDSPAKLQFNIMELTIYLHPPVWDNDNETGIKSATSGDQKITIEFWPATDPDGDNPVRYTLYYTDYTLFGNENPFVWSNVSIEDITSPYELKGLINDHKYYLGVRAKDSKGLEETNTVKLSATPSAPGTNNPPIWVDFAGIQTATPGDKSITVTFGTATDPDGDDPVTYDLYYVDETYTTNNNPFIVPYESINDVSSPYTLTGLTNDHKYWLGVRAKDSKGLKETNTVKKSATPSAPGSNNPPSWSGSVGIQSATAGNTSIQVTFGIATDPDGDDPVTYDLYYVDQTQTGNTDPFSLPNSVKSAITTPYTLTDLTNSHIYCLGVRAKDSKGLSEMNNEKISVIPFLGATGNGNLIWAKQAGGTLFDEYPRKIISQNGDSMVICGYFGYESGYSIVFGLNEPNQTILTSAGNWDLFLARYNMNGNLIWAKRAGSTEMDISSAITSLSDNSTIVTGWTGFSMSEHFYISRYSEDGSLVWLKTTGGSNHSGGNGVITLSDDSSIVTGAFSGTAIFGEGETNQTTLTSNSGTYDIFISKYNPDGTLVWAKAANGSYTEDQGVGITAFTNDSIAITGYFGGSVTFGPGEANQKTITSIGFGDIFIASYNTDGALEWVKRAGGPNGSLYSEAGRAMKTLSDNSIVLTGLYADEAMFGEGEPNETILTTSDVSDTFVARYNPDGSLLWVIQSVVGSGSNIATLSDDSILTTGNGIERYNSFGALIWEDPDIGGALTALNDDSFVTVGLFEDTRVFGEDEPNETVLTSYGGYDIFIARYAP